MKNKKTTLRWFGDPKEIRTPVAAVRGGVLTA